MEQNDAIATNGENKQKRGRPRLAPEEKRQRRNLRRRIAKLRESGKLPGRLKQLEDDLTVRTQPKPRTKREYMARIDKPLAPRGLHRPNDAAYHDALIALLVDTQSQIHHAVYDLNPRLEFRAVGDALDKLRGRVHQFLNVPFEHEAFAEWGTRYALLWANRYQRWYDTVTDKRFVESVRAGVWQWMEGWNPPDTIRQLADDIAADARIWLFSHMNDRQAHTATLFSRVRKHAWHEARKATRARIADAEKHVLWESLAEDEDGNPQISEMSVDEFEAGYVKMLAGHTGELPYNPELETYALDYE